MAPKAKSGILDFEKNQEKSKIEKYNKQNVELNSWVQQ